MLSIDIVSAASEQDIEIAQNQLDIVLLCVISVCCDCLHVTCRIWPNPSLSTFTFGHKRNWKLKSYLDRCRLGQPTRNGRQTSFAIYAVVSACLNFLNALRIRMRGIGLFHVFQSSNQPLPRVWRSFLWETFPTGRIPM